MKDIWRASGQQWDDQLPTDIAQRISDNSELPRLCEMAIPRSYFPVDVDQIELHVFEDSSQEVFSAVAFLQGKTVCSNQRRSVFVIRHRENPCSSHEVVNSP